MISNEFKVTRTRFKEIGVAKIGSDWRFVAIETDCTVGPCYKTKMEALADLPRYATEYGCEA